MALPLTRRTNDDGSGARRGGAQSSSRTWPAWVRYLLYFLIVAGLVTHLSRGGRGPARGQQAADFALQRVNGGGIVKLSDYPGRPVLLEVFASWCSSCRRAAPMVASMASRHRDRVGFIGVSVDETLGQARAVVRRWDIEYPVVLDDGSFSRTYDIAAVPTFILIDREGKVTRVVHGVPRGDELNRWLSELGSPG